MAWYRNAAFIASRLPQFGLDLLWGSVLVVFAAVMLILSARHRGSPAHKDRS